MIISLLSFAILLRSCSYSFTEIHGKAEKYSNHAKSLALMLAKLSMLKVTVYVTATILQLLEVTRACGRLAMVNFCAANLERHVIVCIVQAQW